MKKKFTGITKELFDTKIGLLKEKKEQYGRYIKFFPAAAFVTGFTWDSFTLNRIDILSDNLLMLFYLILLGSLIILSNLIEDDINKNSFLRKYKKWFPLGIQFLLGGLFSGYVVYYFKSASFSKTSVFLVILALLLILNEFLKKRLSNLYLQIGLFYFVNFSFFIFFVPILLGRINYFSFFFGGVISLITAGTLIVFLYRNLVFKNFREFIVCQSIPLILFCLFSLFYVFNWIPPVPLSIQSYGIYHNITKKQTEKGKTLYELKYEKPPWHKPWVQSDRDYKYRAGDRVFCFTSIYAPTKIKKDIYHLWQKYDKNKESWLESDKILMEIKGGREKGYRGYSFKNRVTTGKWKVDVITGEGLLLGRVNFNIVPADSAANLVFKILHR